MDFNWNLIIKWWPKIIQATGVSLEIFIASSICAVVVGILIATMVTAGKPWIAVPCNVYISVFRNSPLLVVLLFLFFGLPSIGIRMSSFAAGILGITLNESAFMAEIIRGNILAVRKGDWEAAESLGLSKMQVLRYAILPQAIRDSLPAITGQLSIVLKDTSILSLIMIVELTRIANTIYTRTFDLSGFMVAALIYISLFFVLNSISTIVENKIRVRR